MIRSITENISQRSASHYCTMVSLVANTLMVAPTVRYRSMSMSMSATPADTKVQSTPSCWRSIVIQEAPFDSELTPPVRPRASHRTAADTIVQWMDTARLRKVMVSHGALTVDRVGLPSRSTR